MTPKEHADAANDLFEADNNRQQIGLLSIKYPDISMADSYAIQSLYEKHKDHEWHKIIEWKIV